jgi:hypothetical protein
MGPVGFEPTTKGFTGPAVSGGSGLSLHPCTRNVRVGAGRSEACHQGRSSPQVVSAPSAGVPAAWLRIAMGSLPKVSLNSSRPLRAFPREGTVSMSPLH